MHIERITSFPKGSLRPCARLVQATLLFRWLSQPFADHRSTPCAWSVVIEYDRSASSMNTKSIRACTCTDGCNDRRLVGTLANEEVHASCVQLSSSRPAPWAVACGAVALPSDRRADRQISWFLVMSSQRHLPVSSLPHAWHTAENAGMHACTSWWFLSLHESMHRQRTRAVNM